MSYDPSAIVTWQMDSQSPLGVPITVEGGPTRGVINGHHVVLAGTNNYLGLTYNPDSIEAAIEALRQYGTGTTGSRMANGTYGEHVALDREIADFYGVASALTFTTGYQANVGTISGLGTRLGHIMLDADSHASIYDGAKLADAQVYRFKHNDADDLAKRLRRLGDDAGRTLVVVEGIYSMLGDQAPMDRIAAVTREYGATLLVDEAHSFGVSGATGRGVTEAFGVEDAVDYFVGTFSKSLGCVGGFCASNHDLQQLIPDIRSYVFSASMTPAVVASARTTLKHIRAHPEIRERLWHNARRVHEACARLGLEIGSTDSPIVSVILRTGEDPWALWHGLLEQGVYVNLIAPPASPGNYLMLRASISAGHSDEDVDRIIAAYRWLKGRNDG